MSGFDLSSVRSIEEAELSGKRVLIRADLNVPMQGGAVSDATRIERILPTVELARNAGAKVVILSHFGRPKGVASAETSLRPVAAKLQELMPEANIGFLSDCAGPDIKAAIDKLQAGDVVLLENLRYHRGEEANDDGFAKDLAALGDIYVNDAFSAAHRAHASTAAIAELLPAYAGLSMIAELRALGQALETPQRPVMAIVGGSKVSTKIDVLNNLAEKVDVIVVGGGMANTFLFADGYDVGRSLCEKEAVGTVAEIRLRARSAGCEIVLPKDCVVAEALQPGVATETCSISDVPADSMILDVGPATVADLNRRLGDVKTLLWNGPLGAFETPPFEEGTFAVAREAARLTAEGRLISVGGGGDTVAALNEAGAADKFTYVSTAGGAFLEWLEGKELPGVAALARSAGKGASVSSEAADIAAGE